MLKYQNSTILLNALFTEISEMATMVASTPNVTKVTLDGISIPVNKEVSGFAYGQEDGSSRVDLNTLLKGINHDCASISCDLGYALRIAAETTKIDTDMSVYGMTWASKADSNFRINVLHPVVVQAIIAGEYDKVISLESEGTLYVFEYKAKNSRKFYDVFAEEVIERWAEVLTVLSTEAYSPNTSLKCSSNMGSICNAIRQGSQSIENTQVAFSESGNNPQKVITPTMFVTQGMLFPYYGAIMSRLSGSRYESRDLMHFGSCNLDHRRDIGAWGGTCTGSLNNGVYASLRVLTNLNMGSAHHTDVISNRGDIRTYVKVSQEISAEMLFEHFKGVWEVPEEAPSEADTGIEESIEKDEKSDTEVVQQLGATPEVVVKKRGRPSKASLAESGSM